MSNALMALIAQGSNQFDPLKVDAQIAQTRAYENKNKLFDMQVAESQRALEQENKLNALYQSAVGQDGAVDRSKLYTGMAQGGFGSKLPAVQKQFAEVDKTTLETEKAKYATALEKFAVAGRIMAPVKDQASWDAARAQTAEIFGPDAAAKMPAVYDPNLVARKVQESLSVKEQMEQKFKELDQQLKVAQFGETQRHNRAQEGISYGNLGVAQANLGLRREELTQKKTMDKETIKQNSQKVNDARDVLGLLDEVDALLPKATNGALGVAGNFVAGTMGMSTEGANATAQLKALQGALVSKMPKMTGPQSDKDVQLYREMAGQVGDPMVPRAQRQAAAATIRKLNEKYAGVPEGSSKKSGGVVDFGSLK